MFVDYVRVYKEYDINNSHGTIIRRSISSLLFVLNYFFHFRDQ